MSKVRILSPRPEINKNAAVDAVFFIYFGGTVYSNDKILLSGSNVSLALSQDVINLRGIRDNLPAFATWQIYSLSPRPDINKNTAVDAVFLYYRCDIKTFDAW